MRARKLAWVALLLVLVACKGVGLGQFDTETSTDKANDAWWDKFYGNKPADSN